MHEKEHMHDSQQEMPDPASAPEPSAGARSSFRAVLPLLLFGAGALIFLLPEVREQFGRIHEISAYLKSLGWVAPFAFIATVAVLVTVGVPRLFLCPIGGMAFGFWLGLLWVQLGTLLGYYVTFLFVHWVGRDFVLRKWPRLGRYADITRRNGIVSVLIVRQLPITGFYSNVMLGLMPLKHAHFLLGSFVGTLSAAVPATLVGSGATALSSGESKMYTFLAIAAGIVLWLLAGRFIGSFLKKKRAENGPEALDSDPVSPE